MLLEAQYVSAVVTIVGIGAVLTGSELLCLRREWGIHGLFSWSVVRTRFPRALRSGFVGALDVIYAYPRSAACLLLQIVCGLALATHAFESHTFSLLLVLLVAHLLTTLRFHGLDGADQMQTILLFSLVCYYMTREAAVQRLALWFVSLQLMLAYFTAGLVKLWSKQWRSGAIFRQSLAIGSGSEFVYNWFPDDPRLSRALCWGVIGFECLFPFAAFASPRICLSLLFIGVLFHIVNAVAFGLPRFVFTFVAAYPALWCCARETGFLRQL